MDSKQKPNLYLVGFMGTGKSTIGRLAAQKLKLQFEDSDSAIEAAQGRSIPEIFESDGEAAFREMERDYIEANERKSGLLVACGGGLVVQAGMLELMKSKGLVFSLMASAEGVYERVKSSTNRPLLKVEDPLAEIRRMLEIRDPFYREAHAQILTEGRTIPEVVGHVCRAYKQAAAKLKK